MVTLPKADGINVESLRRWLQANGKGNLSISGPGASTWGDLTALRQPKTAKPLLLQLFLQLFHLLRNAFWPSRENGLDLVVPPRPDLTKIDPISHSISELFELYLNFRHAIRQARGSKPNDHDEELPTPTQKSREEKASIGASGTSESLGVPGPNDPPPILSGRMARVLILLGFTLGNLRYIITTLVACLLPTVAIAILATLHTTPKLIGVIGALTFVFGIGLMFFTSKRPTRVEIFSATAA